MAATGDGDGESATAGVAGAGGVIASVIRLNTYPRKAADVSTKSQSPFRSRTVRTSPALAWKSTFSAGPGACRTLTSAAVTRTCSPAGAGQAGATGAITR